MVQQILVGLIGVIVAIIIIRKVYGFFFSKNEQKGSCGCSSCGCHSAKKGKII